MELTRDSLHLRARDLREAVLGHGARLFTSIAVILETFTFLERNANRDVALAWKDSLSSVESLEVLCCGLKDLERAWSYFGRRDLHRLSAVDATSFVLMKRESIRLAFSFDHHFATVGFRLVG